MANNNKHTGPNVPALRFPEFSGEWEKVKLGDSCTFFSGGTPSSSRKEYYCGDIPFIRSGELHSDSTALSITKEAFASCSAKMVNNGDLLLALYGATSGDISISRINGAINQAILCIRPKHLNTYFIKSLWESHKKQILETYLQGGQGNLSSEIIKNISFMFPNIEEQNKISELVRKIDKRISTQSKIIEEQETLLKSLADILFRQNNHLCPLSELVDIIKGKQLNADNLSEEGDFYVMNGGITPSGYYSEYNVPAGAISISEGGNSCGYVQFNEEPFWSGGHCYSLRSKNTIVDYKYIYYFLKAKQADVMALRIGSGLPNIQKKDIEKFTISFPSVQLQKQIVKALDALSEKINTEKQFLEKYCQQKNYLLSKLFI